MRIGRRPTGRRPITWRCGANGNAPCGRIAGEVPIWCAGRGGGGGNRQPGSRRDRHQSGGHGNHRGPLALIRLGEAAALHDPKLAALVLEIRLIRLAHLDANILVYTEYADSQQAAVDALSKAGLDGTILTICGTDPEVRPHPLG